MDGNFGFDMCRTGGEDQNAVRQTDGLRQIVGNQDGGLSGFSDDLTDIGRDHQSCLIIQGTEWLVEQQNLRVQG